MTQVVVIQKQTPDKSYSLVGSEAKNPLPSSNLSWEDVAGLSWIFIDEFDQFYLEKLERRC